MWAPRSGKCNTQGKACRQPVRPHVRHGLQGACCACWWWLAAGQGGRGVFTMEGMSATCTAGQPSMSAVSATVTTGSRILQQDAALQHHGLHSGSLRHHATCPLLLLAPASFTVPHQHCSPATADAPMGRGLQSTVARLVWWGMLAPSTLTATVCRTTWCHGMMTGRGVGEGVQVGGGG